MKIVNSRTLRPLSWMRAGLIAATLTATAAPSVLAQGELVRISVKRVLGPGGTPNSAWTAATIQRWIDDTNRLFAGQSGFYVRLCEIQDVADPGTNPSSGSTLPWFNPVTSNVTQMESDAEANPRLYLWNDQAINVYLVNSLTNSSGRGVGGICSFPNSSHQELILVQPRITNGSVGFAHELGHYFDLMHTQETVRGVEQAVSCQTQSPNCATAGDQVCDTPADPYTSSLSQAQNIATLNAQYGTGSCFGANSAPFNTLRFNVMSYYSAIAVNQAIFTPGQRARMRNALLQSRTHVMGRAVSVAWTQLDPGLAGQQGIPALIPTPPRMGRQFNMHLEAAMPNALSMFVLGVRAVNAPWYGGTFVPEPLITLHAYTDALGRASQGFFIPDVPTLIDLPLYVQSFVWDPGAPQGMAVSEAFTGKLYRSVQSDFNGDGMADMAIGSPTEDVGPSSGNDNAGAVSVIYADPSGGGLTGQGAQHWDQNRTGVGGSEVGDQFGSALVEGDFDGDGCADLAVGIPLEDVGYGGTNYVDAGAVVVLYGSSASGLTSAGAQLWHQGSFAVGSVENGDQFGKALAVGDFDGDGYDDLAVGAPEETLGGTFSGKIDAGTVFVLYGSPTGLSANGVAEWNLDSSGVQGLASTRDLFGSSLFAGDFDADGRDDLAVGAPGDKAGSVDGAGTVTVLFGASSGLTTRDQRLYQSLWDIPGTPETGDAFGSALVGGDFDRDGYCDLAIGVPGEAVGPQSQFAGAGAVNVIYGGATGLSTRGQIWHQSSPGIAGSSEAQDSFGEALAVGDFDDDGFDDLAIAAPGEDLEYLSVNRAGIVHILEGSDCGLTAGIGQVLKQDLSWIPESPESSDEFGHALACGDIDGDGCADLVIGVPHEDARGMIHVLHGTRGMPALSGNRCENWAQGTGIPGTAEIGDMFGWALPR